MVFEQDVINALKRVGIKEPKLDKTPRPEMGDLSFACFTIGGPEKAKELVNTIKPEGLIAKVEQMGPYVNFFIDVEKLANQIVKDVLKKGYGGKKVKGKALVEHTSTNPNASPHVGRARNSLIGDALVRLLKYYGYNVETHYFVNDIGKQIAMLVYSTKKMKGKLTFQDMLRRYIEMNTKVLENVTLEKEILELLHKFEKGNKKTMKEFEKVVKISIKGQASILKDLGIKFNSFDYESKYVKSKATLKKILAKLKKYTYKDENKRLILDLKQFKLPMETSVLVLTRADGTSLYPLRDIAYHLDKAKWSKGGKNIIVLGEDHKLEYEQIKAALSLLKEKAPEVVFYSFVLLPEGKMSTRRGNLVLLTDFMAESVQQAKTEILKRHDSIKPAELEKLSKIIGYGALKYSILKVSPEKNVTFSWEEALNFEGNSAPYLQYTYVRAKKLLGRLGKLKKPKILTLTEDSEKELVKKFAEFPDIIQNCAESYQVHSLARYCYDLAETFNNFYEKCRVIDAESPIKETRAQLVKAYINLIKNSLSLLGITVPDFM